MPDLHPRLLVTYTFPLDAETLVKFELPRDGLRREEMERLAALLQALVVEEASHAF